MHKYNKIRGILRAKQGSQIPKFQQPWSTIQFNPNNVGSTQAIPLFNSEQLLNETLGKPTNTTPKYSSLNGMEYLRPRSQEQATQINTLMSQGYNLGELAKTSVENNKLKQGLNKIGKGINKGIGQYGDYIGAGLSVAGNALFGQTEDSEAYQTVDNVLGIASNIPVVGKYAAALKGVVNFANGLGASTIDATGLDSSTIEKSGGSYGGTLSLNNQVQSDRNKKFGLFNRGGYKAAQGRADKLLNQKSILENIISENEDYQSMVNDLNYTKFNIQQNGGYQQFLRAAKQGGTLTQKIDLIKSRKFNQVINVNTKQVEEFKDGGVFPSHVDNSSINYPVCKLEWEPEIKLFEEWEPEIILEVEEFKAGGTIKEELETPEIEETTQKNLIPEGALHKNKHHMEHTEGLTQKGIPVVDNEGEQQAEIELDEIIFTLEVTKKLEELYKDGTDEAAIEAGKLLVKEILFNTDDRTGLIAKCEKGGIINEFK